MMGPVPVILLDRLVAQNSAWIWLDWKSSYGESRMKGLSALTEQLRKYWDCEPIVQLSNPPPLPLLPSVPSFQIYKAPFLLICKKKLFKAYQRGFAP